MMDSGDEYDPLELLCYMCLAEGEEGPAGWEESEFGWVCPECVTSEAAIGENEGLNGMAAAMAAEKEKGE